VQLVRENGFDGVVTLVQGKIEEVQLPSEFNFNFKYDHSYESNCKSSRDPACPTYSSKIDHSLKVHSCCCLQSRRSR
jgi:hypothetical protein